jgi:formate dehydrogenase subunit gamma
MSDTALPGSTDPRRRATILRYSRRERINHWLVALSFILAGLSGLAMFHPGLFWLSVLFGGGPETRVIHPYLGLVMVLLFVSLAIGVHADNPMKPRDWAWLRQWRDVVSNREDRLPEVGRYNAGQKLVFYTIVICLTVLLITGIFIWRAHFAQYFPLLVLRVSSLVHAAFAFALICTIIVHIYAGIWVKGSIRAMTRGTVTPGWAWKHHRAWYREMTAHAANSRPRSD